MSSPPFEGLALGRPPAPGFRSDHHEQHLSDDASYFPVAREALLNWQLQRRGGMQVLDRRGREAGPVQDGATAVLLITLFGLHLRAPVRVIRLVDAQNVAGFVYRAEPGHPERGEEAFLVHLHPTGAVSLELTSVSRPAMPYALLAPLARRIQTKFTKRYLQALRPRPEAAI